MSRGGVPGTPPEIGWEPPEGVELHAEAGEATGAASAPPEPGETPRAELSVGAIRDFLLGFPRFFRLLLGLMGDARISLFDRALLGASLAYLFVPVDLLPDWLPGLGQMDDLLVVAVALDRLLHRTPRDVLLEHWSGDPAPLLRLLDLLDRGMERLPRWVRGLLHSG